MGWVGISVIFGGGFVCFLNFVFGALLVVVVLEVLYSNCCSKQL